MLTPQGFRAIETLSPGEFIYSADQHNPECLVEISTVSQCFRRLAPVWELRVGGRSIRMTSEHPLFTQERGWVPLHDLQIGDRIRGMNGEWTTVESIIESNEVEVVYNIEVSNYHTFFVGSPDWNFSIWVHNTDICVPPKWREEFNALPELTRNGKTIKERYLLHLEKEGANASSPSEFAKILQRNWTNADKGSDFQNKVRDALGAPRGKGSGHHDIGDKRIDLPTSRYGVTDIKDVEELEKTKQIQVFIDHAKEKGLPLNFIISPNTKYISSTIIAEVRATGGKIFEYNPTTGRFSTLELPMKGVWRR